jgi:glutamine amidotransferase
MCRLLAFRAAEPRSLYGPLWSAPNALARQSTEHPDGWGIAHLHLGGEMKLFREVAPAHGSGRFREHARAVRSEVVVAHVRKASVGGNLLRNTHPFTHDGWVFAHNGTIRRFSERRGAFERRIDPALRRQLTGDTDSERCFFMFLTELRRESGDTLEAAARALGRVARFTRDTDPVGVPRPSVANFVATDGDRLVAIRFGKMLHVSAGRGPLRDGAQVEALLVSSEPVDEGPGWRLLAHGQGVAVDRRMTLHRFRA